MPTPKDGYRLKDGRSVDGASVISDFFKDKGGVTALTGWGYSVGKKAGLAIAAAAAAGIEDFKPPTIWSELKKAGDIGTEVHRMVEQYIRGLKVDCLLPEAEDNAAAWRAFGGFQVWLAPMGVKFLVEELERSLVSEAKEYGGTPDAIGKIGAGLTLFDWKTGAFVYKSALRQAAAYRNVWDENHPDTPITNGAYIVRFDKKTGRFDWHHPSNAELDVGFESFLGFYEEMRRDRALEVILERSKARA